MVETHIFTNLLAFGSGGQEQHARLISLGGVPVWSRLVRPGSRPGPSRAPRPGVLMRKSGAEPRGCLICPGQPPPRRAGSEGPPSQPPGSDRWRSDHFDVPRLPNQVHLLAAAARIQREAFNRICMPSDHSPFHRGEIEETIIESIGNDHSTLDGYSRRTTLPSKLYHTKGQEGSVCLRSSDCATGLCCARHFWSKICKPVLKEGQVCTKHRRKGSHGLEIFQRCYCGDGLSCRMQKDHHQASNSSRLHTCQRH
ncbi:dickkopf-related protein 1 [Puma concolor]|uniref:Dickkopf-related protein 1 n=1 Tax=Puma concolor TaxID=9696 RepID=A0A6P6H4T1_PUMCO|nr:dickkopf-related protein 1 [Puma concolor]